MSKLVTLSRGYCAIVDDEDFERVSQYKWYSLWSERRKTCIAITSVPKRGARRRQVTLYMHRFIMNADPKLQVDHINHDTLDNRRSNLRLCTNAQNQMNRKLSLKNARSGFKGVHWHKRDNIWEVHIKASGRFLYLGRFVNVKDAAKAYNEAATRYFGEFAYLNIIETGESL